MTSPPYGLHRLRARHVLRAVLATSTLATSTLAAEARAQTAPAVATSAASSTTSPAAAATPPPTQVALDLEKAPPPPTNIVYAQYGVAFAAESVLAAGPICDNEGIPCILGNGGGIVVRGGWRGAGPFYFGGAYELTKQDPNKLYRIALLQQARAEARYYANTARVTEPYLALGAGVAGYGNEWGIDTWGPGGSIGAGVEYQITRSTVVGLAINYRALWFSRFTDTSGAARDAGLAQLFGLDLVLEQREAIVTAAPGSPHRHPE